jgi:UDP-glucose 4-epimerase
VAKLVFSSTSTMFGNLTQNRNIREDDPKESLNPYGDSKLASEMAIKDIALASNLKYVILRYFNAAGAALDGKNGQRTTNAYHLVHVASQAALGKRAELGIFGTDYPTADGTCIRDYIHVEDLAAAHVLVTDYLLKGGSSDEFNCGYGRGYSVKEVVETMKKVTGVNFKTVVTERRPGDAAFLVADPTKLKTKLQWTPLYADIDLICKSAYEWEKKLS